MTSIYGLYIHKAEIYYSLFSIVDRINIV